MPEHISEPAQRAAVTRLGGSRSCLSVTRRRRWDSRVPAAQAVLPVTLHLLAARFAPEAAGLSPRKRQEP